MSKTSKKTDLVTTEEMSLDDDIPHENVSRILYNELNTK